MLDIHTMPNLGYLDEEYTEELCIKSIVKRLRLQLKFHHCWIMDPVPPTNIQNSKNYKALAFTFAPKQCDFETNPELMHAFNQYWIDVFRELNKMKHHYALVVPELRDYTHNKGLHYHGIIYTMNEVQLKKYMYKKGLFTRGQYKLKLVENEIWNLYIQKDLSKHGLERCIPLDVNKTVYHAVISKDDLVPAIGKRLTYDELDQLKLIRTN